MSADAGLPPGAVAPHTDDELKRLRLFDGLDDEAVTDRKVAEMCGLDSLGRAVMLPELDYVRLRRAATRANRPPDEEHGRPSEWERVVRELAHLKEAILAATGYRDPSVGRMLTTDQIVERVTRASRERAAALPPDALAELEYQITNDAYAMTFQSLGQYRTALLKNIRALRPTDRSGP